MCVTWLIHMWEVAHWFVHLYLHVAAPAMMAMCERRQSCVWRDWFLCERWLIHTWDVTNLCVRHESFIGAVWLVHACVVAHLYLHVPAPAMIAVCETEDIHVCDMTHSYVRCGSFIRVIRLIYVCVMTHSYVRCNTFMRRSWLIHMCMFQCRQWWLSTCVICVM